MASFVQLGECMSPNGWSFCLPLFPRSSAACGEMSRYSRPPVFFCLNIIRVKSPCSCMSPQVSLNTSLRLSPVRQENRKAFLMFGYSHSVFASSFSSSMVRYILVPSSGFMPSMPLMGLSAMIRSSYAWFRHAFSFRK